MRTPLALTLGLAFVLALSGAQAHHCATWTTSTTNSEMIVLELPENWSTVRYVVNDLCQDPTDEGDPNDPYDGGGCLFSIWLYMETNEIPGLQRGDEVVDDSCHWQIESDYFVW